MSAGSNRYRAALRRITVAALALLLLLSQAALPPSRAASAGASREWRYPWPDGRTLTAIAYGAGRYLAAGAGGALLTSADGHEWKRAEDAPSAITALAYGNGRFVAAGQWSVLTATDGAAWRKAPLPTTGTFTGLAYGASTFVAATDSGELCASSTGEGWSPCTPTGRVRYGAVLFAGGQFVAGGSDGVVMTSPDGRTWTRRSTPVGDQIVAIAYGNDRYVAVTQYSEALTSPDGVVWTKLDLGEWRPRTVAFGAGRFVISTWEDELLTATDGRSWKAAAFPQAGSLTAITFLEGQFLAAGENGTIFTSPDGLLWTRRQGADSLHLADLAYGGGQYVAAGYPGVLLSSSDGRRWSRRESGTQAEIYDVVYGAGRFVATGAPSDFNGTLFTSADGLSWSRGETDDGWIEALTYGADGFVGVGYGGISHSVTGDSWQNVWYSTELSLRDVTYGDGLYVAVGPLGNVLTSRDGRSWTHQTLKPAANLWAVTAGNGLFVAVGDSPGGGIILTSPDGITWTERAKTAGQVTSVTFGGGLFLATMSYSGLTSRDGLTWSYTELGSGVSIEKAVYANGEFLLLTETGVIAFDPTITVPAGAHLPEPPLESQRALAYLNQLRTAGGLPELTINPALVEAARSHAEYLARNDEFQHEEIPGHPGFTGRDPGIRAVYFGNDLGAGEVLVQGRDHRAEAAIDDWIATLYHRLLVLQPTSGSFGYGRSTTEHPIHAVDMDRRGQTGYEAKWPYPGQTGVPLAWGGGEEPNPLRLYPGAAGPFGYPVTLEFGTAPGEITLAVARLTGPDGREVPVLRFSRENDVYMFGAAVGLIPNQRLQPATTYTVFMSGKFSGYDGTETPWERSWQFTTRPAGPQITDLTIDASSGNLTLTGSGLQGTRAFWNGLPVSAAFRGGKEEALSFTIPTNPPDQPLAVILVDENGQTAVRGAYHDSRVTPPNPLRPATAAIRLGEKRITADARVYGAEQLLLLSEAAVTELLPGPQQTGERRWWRHGESAGALLPADPRALIDGRTVLLPLGAQQAEGKLWIPFAFVEQLAGASLEQVTLLPPPCGSLFTDVKADRPSCAAIESLAQRKVLGGYQDGTFRPEQSLTRAEFAKLVVQALGSGPQPGAALSFSDTAGHWAAKQGYLQAAVSMGAVSGFPDRSFKPDQTITRAQIIRAVAGAASLTPVTASAYADVKGTDWFAPWVGAAYKAGLIGPAAPFPVFTLPTLSPDRPVTREEAALLLANGLARKKQMK